MFKGYKSVIIRRDFASFIINHPVSNVIKDYLKDANIPDEHLYATLSRIKSIKPIYHSNKYDVTEPVQVKKYHKTFLFLFFQAQLNTKCNRKKRVKSMYRQISVPEGLFGIIRISTSKEFTAALATDPQHLIPMRYPKENRV